MVTQYILSNANKTGNLILLFPRLDSTDGLKPESLSRHSVMAGSGFSLRSWTLVVGLGTEAPNSIHHLGSGGSQTRLAFSPFWEGNIFCFLQPYSFIMKASSRFRPNTTVKWQSWEWTDRSLGLRKPRSVVYPRGTERWLLQGTPVLKKSLLTWGTESENGFRTLGNKNDLSRKPVKIMYWGTSLAVQWLRLHLPVQGEQVWSLGGELRSHMPCGWKTKT